MGVFQKQYSNSDFFLFLFWFRSRIKIRTRKLLVSFLCWRLCCESYPFVYLYKNTKRVNYGVRNIDSMIRKVNLKNGFEGRKSEWKWRGADRRGKSICPTFRWQLDKLDLSVSWIDDYGVYRRWRRCSGASSVWRSWWMPICVLIAQSSVATVVCGDGLRSKGPNAPIAVPLCTSMSWWTVAGWKKSHSK